MWQCILTVANVVAEVVPVVVKVCKPAWTSTVMTAVVGTVALATVAEMGVTVVFPLLWLQL